MASRATRALNAALWLGLGFLMDLLPPVTWVPGSKSTYTRVRISGASSKNLRQREFRDYNPDRVYPVMGDSAERGMEAQPD